MMMKLKFLLVWLLLQGLCLNVPAQILPIRNVPSPEIAGLGEYGKVPVSLFTGIPDISIPLYEVKVGDYSLPISANYHLGSVKANSPSGSLGLGWSLIAGGYITRSVRGLMDEAMYSDVSKPGYYDNSWRMKNIDWSIFLTYNEHIRNKAGQTEVYELSADEFSFNFCGYSGNFYYNENGGWSVVSDQDIKVVFDHANGFGSARGAFGGTDSKSWSRIQSNCRSFNKFTLITPDGCQYEFGGGDAIEYSISYFSRQSNDLVPTTWRLSKITTPNKKVIEFGYISSTTCDIKYVPQESHYSINNIHIPGTSVGRAGLTGFLLFNAHLKYIKTPNEFVDFSYIRDIYFGKHFRYNNEYRSALGWVNSAEVEDRFNIYKQFGVDDHPSSQFHLFLGIDTNYKTDKDLVKAIEDCLDNQILTSIAVKKAFGSQAYRTIDFTYNDNPQEERRKLKSISEKVNAVRSSSDFQASNVVLPSDKSGGLELAKVIDWQYNFKYNTDKKLPMSYIVPSADSWGYYNGGKNSLSAAQQEIFGLSAVSPSSAKADILTEIQFPTGGKNKFEYEAHHYSKYVNETRTGLINEAKQAGGLRVKSITKTDPLDHVLEVKIYYYSDERKESATLNGSGILNSKPINYYKYTAKEGEYVEYKSKGGFFPSVTSQNSPHVGYSCVIEETFDNQGVSQGYSKYRYSNFDKDIYGQSHLDSPVEYSHITDFIRPYESRSVERGKLLSEEHFDKNDQLKKKVTYHYKRTDDFFLVTGHQMPIHIPILGVADWSLGSLGKTHLYSYLPDQITETEYTDLAGKTIERSRTLTYNAFKMLKKETTQTSNGDSRSVEYKYLGDDPDHKYLLTLYLDHVLSPIVERITSQGTDFKYEKFKYLALNGIPYIQEASTFYGMDYCPTEKYTVNQKDIWANPVEIEENGVKTVFIWGYQGQKIIAKIVNASLDQLSLPSSFLKIENPKSPDAYSQLESIRTNLPSSQFYIYKYDDRLQLESMTNPNGVAVFFNYDYMGRLVERYYTEKENGVFKKRLLNSYEYNYQQKK